VLFSAATISAASVQQSFGQSQVTLNGAGATFPYPLVDTWRVEYQKVKSNVNINYQSIGSGGGIKQFTDKTVDFGASDAPMTATQRQAVQGTPVHIPETIGSVVAAYNIPEIPNKGLKLTGPILADIFAGKVKKWDDEKIKAINPGVSLPAKDIVVVHRSDGSGTTFIWTSYLSKVSQDWSDNVGKGTSVQWPAEATQVGAPGNEGVANGVKGTSYTIGYVELTYALKTKMAYASLQNKEGNFVEPTLESTRAAVANAATNLPKGEESWENVSLLDAPGAESYPIASFSYFLVYKDLSANPSLTEEKATSMVNFMTWAITDGQEFSESLSYVPLPDSVVNHDLEILRSLTYKDVSMASAVPEFPIMSIVMAAAIGAIVFFMAIAKRGRLSDSSVISY
jgi:phosphate transport system permease protein/phosphate transport system substrate-binding protein